MLVTYIVMCGAGIISLRLLTLTLTSGSVIWKDFNTSLGFHFEWFSQGSFHSRRSGPYFGL